MQAGAPWKYLSAKPHLGTDDAGWRGAEFLRAMRIENSGGEFHSFKVTNLFENSVS